MNEKLKPCPFCGNEDLRVEKGVKRMTRIRCWVCGATNGYVVGRYNAESRWNRRLINEK